MDASFTLESYRQLVTAFQTAGYRFIKFTDAIPAQPYVYWRHDIDISLEDALQIAHLENTLNLQSTYFFLLRSPLYNLLSEFATRTLQTIAGFGHDLALHVDLALYADNPVQAVLDELRLLQQFYPMANGQIVSFHRPGILGKAVYDLQLPVRHTYEAPFFKDIKYFSDSKGGWHYGHPLASAEFAARQPMQVVTHPIWWCEAGATPLAKLAHFAGTAYHRTVDHMEQAAVSFPLTEIKQDFGKVGKSPHPLPPLPQGEGD